MNNPNRRTFLKLIGASVVGTVLPLPTSSSSDSAQHLLAITIPGGKMLHYAEDVEFSPGNPAA